jgi:hypothetical protein
MTNKISACFCEKCVQKKKFNDNYKDSKPVKFATKHFYGIGQLDLNAKTDYVSLYDIYGNKYKNAF